MRLRFFWTVVAVVMPVLSSAGAERSFNFGSASTNLLPGFRNAVGGEGKPGRWEVILDDAPSALGPLTPRAPSVSKRAVLAQVARDPTDQHFPMLIYDDEIFGDFTLTTQFKIVEGAVEQMAGLAFRIQDERNYYYVRASALGNNFSFFWFVNGELLGPIGVKAEITRNIWHEMSVECKGSFITCSLDGKVAIPQLKRDNYPKGKIGFWTKADSVSYFADTRIVYTPRENPAQTLVTRTCKTYNKLLGLRVYVNGSQTNAPLLVASSNQKEVGQQGGAAEQDVINRGKTYFAKTKAWLAVTVPLRDRNGDAIAAVCVEMKSFAGQTEKNAVERAVPIVKEMQKNVQSLQDLVAQ